MYAQLVQQLAEGNDWLYEVKFDGYRCLAGREPQE
jgi:ATP-dependent DNA ligase